AAAVGQELESAERDLTVRAVLAYAAGLGAHEAAFLDDARPEGLAALPFQCVSLEWPVVLSLRAALAGLSLEEGRRGVHAVQDSVFHRPMRPGERLRTTGRLVAARPSRAGVLTTIRLQTCEARTGEPVTTSWSSSIWRGVSLAGEASALAEPPPLPPGADAPLPEDAASEAIVTAREAAHVYTECAGIWNPIHSERTVALAAGLPDIILHGTATWALAGLAVLRRCTGCEGARLRRFTGRFTGMVIPGETLTLRHALLDEGLVGFEVRNAAGAAALSRGVAVLAPEG
ncbi:MAG: MaoC family dehydratase N-terminal domain-containing protein, partial [Acidobacteria bacterium]|nr:MaoC family dehydratase N-terminal domain-containing protein [Acidobacteriota bacterium]